MAAIVLVDDDRNILESVSIGLEADGHEVKTFRDGAGAFACIGMHVPDLVITDIKMPAMDGMELLERIRRKSGVPLIFLTSKDEETDEMTGLHAGADDYIRKPFSQRLLLERVRAVLRRVQPDGAVTHGEEKQLIRQGGLVLDLSRHVCTWKAVPVTLTVTEFLILESLARRPGFVKSRDQLMDAAYDDQVYVDDRTIDSHIKRMRRKFRMVDENFDSIETLYGVGYRYRKE